MKRIALILSLLYSTHAFGQNPDSAAEHEDIDTGDLVLTLKMGAPAPWTGTLMSAGAAAKIISTIDFKERECEANRRHALAAAQNKFDFEKRLLDAEITTFRVYHEGVVKSKDKHIQDLVDIKTAPLPTEMPFYKTPAAYLTYGLLSGAAITLAGAYFIKN
jgi:hypothetical protein